MGSVDSLLDETSDSSSPNLGETLLSRSSLRLELTVSDPECLEALMPLPAGRQREDFAIRALRIGVIALRQAEGKIDTESLRNEGERVLTAFSGILAEHKNETEKVLLGTLKDYFNPEDGRFSERVERLIKHDGELERVMRGQFENNQRGVREVFTEFLGADSGFLKILTPDESNRFLGAIKENLATVLSSQSGQILKEFSLDNLDSALSRLVRELKERHGELTGDLQKRIDQVVKEFSLDDEASALSRLVRRVEQAQKQISAEFSLDEDKSALVRLKRELMDVLVEHQKKNEAFQSQIQLALEGMRVRKEEAARSTTHGRSFEDEGYRVVTELSLDSGDIVEHVGATTGIISRSKIGDAVVTLGPDSVAAGARIVVEFKEDSSYTLKSTLAEIEEARKNRDARIGLFVHSKRTSQVDLRPISRYGDDVVVTWDQEDAQTDIYLHAGLMIAKALSTRAIQEAKGESIDLSDFDKSIREIERLSTGFEEIRTKCGSIKSATDSIVNRADIMQRGMLKQIQELDEQVFLLKLKAGTADL